MISGYVKIAIENGHRNSGFSHWKWYKLWSIVTIVFYVEIMNDFDFDTEMEYEKWKPKSTVY